MNLIRRLHDPSLAYVRLGFRQELLHSLAAVMEALWMAPWFAVVLAGARAVPPYALICYVVANILVALGIVRLLDAWGMYEDLRQLVFLCGLLLAILWSVGVIFPPPPAEAPVVQPVDDSVAPIQQVTLPPLLPVLILLGVLWWRGLRLAIVPPTPTRVAFGMRLGILFFFGAALIPDAQPVTLASLPLFFFFGLLANSLARAASLRETPGHGTTFGARWGIFMTLAAVGITLAGFVSAALLAGVSPELFAQLLQPILAALFFVFAILMIPVLLVVQVIVEALVNAFANVGLAENVIQTPSVQAPPGSQQTNRLMELLEQLRQFIDQIGGLQMCVTVLVVLIVVVVILLTLRRYRHAMLPEDEVREDLEGDVLAGLRHMLRRGWKALSGALNAVGQFGLGRNLFAALTIRRIYAQMARLAASEGYPRPASATPYEYQITLQQAFPAVQAEINLITEAYVRVHYGEVPESEEALQRVIAAWNTLKAGPAS